MAKHSHRRSNKRSKNSCRRSVKKTSRRRCPPGSRRSGRKCVPNKTKRCPNGSRRNKETGNCIPRVVKIVEQAVKDEIKEKVEKKIMNELKEEIKANPNELIPIIEKQAEKTATKKVNDMIQNNKNEYLENIRKQTNEFYDSLTLHELLVILLGDETVDEQFHNVNVNTDNIKKLVDNAMKYILLDIPDLREEDKIVFEAQKKQLETKFDNYVKEINNMKVKTLEEKKQEEKNLEDFALKYENMPIERILEEHLYDYVSGALLPLDDVPRTYRHVARNIQRQFGDHTKSEIVKLIVKKKLWAKVEEAKKNKNKFIEI